MTNDFDDDIDDLPASFLNPTGLTTGQGTPNQDDAPLEATLDETAPTFVLEGTSFDMRLIEAVLFAASAPLAIADLQREIPHLDTRAFRPLLARLMQDYDGRGVVLEESDGRWAFRTASDLSNALNGLRVEERPLSRAGQETLAVIAYHQPITRPEIEAVRGVATSKGTIDALLETGWVKPGRRRESPGRPLTWVTTPTFLDHFGLETIMDLPGLDDLKATGMLDRRPAASITADLFDNDDGDGDDVAASADDQVPQQQQG